MNKKRTVGYLNEDMHKRLTLLLKDEGMTISGWLRKMAKEFIEQKSKRS